MDQLKNGGKVRRGRLGVGIQEITSDLARSLGLENVHGVLVNSVDRDGPAERAGIHTGDIITAVNGSRVDSANALRNHIAGTGPGSTVTLTILRDGHEQQLRARLTELSPENEPVASAGGAEGGHEQLGITVEPLTADRAAELGLRRSAEGVVVTSVEPS